jgi:hypothetical protein
VDVEAVAEAERLALLHLRGNLLLVDLRLVFVRDQNVHDVAALRSIRDIEHIKTVLHRLLVAGVLYAPYYHLAAGVAQVFRLRLALVAVADYRYGLLLEYAQIRILLVTNLRHLILLKLILEI